MRIVKFYHLDSWDVVMIRDKLVGDSRIRKWPLAVSPCISLEWVKTYFEVVTFFIVWKVIRHWYLSTTFYRSFSLLWERQRAFQRSHQSAFFLRLFFRWLVAIWWAFGGLSGRHVRNWAFRCQRGRSIWNTLYFRIVRNCLVDWPIGPVGTGRQGDLGSQVQSGQSKGVKVDVP